tara:strand:+ start:1539 stop:1796 length:258 start_codon:yes stop_codon:yes gene_type:complete
MSKAFPTETTTCIFGPDKVQHPSQGPKVPPPLPLPLTRSSQQFVSIYNCVCSKHTSRCVPEEMPVGWLPSEKEKEFLGQWGGFRL